MTDEEMIEVTVTVLWDTDDAVKVSVDDGEVWIPKSQISNLEEMYLDPGSIEDVRVPEWLAIEKGLV